MVKRAGNLWADIVSMDNLTLALKNATKRKKRDPEVQKILEDPEPFLREIQKSLINHTFRSSEYHTFPYVEKRTRKIRVIAALPFYPDRIVHWALMQVAGPILTRSLIPQTYASIPGRGTHKALKQLDKYLEDPKVKYCLQTDIKKYFPSISKINLKNKLRRKIKDRDCLWLMDAIIDEYPLSGIPIGNYTSQFFANYYFSEIDHDLKEKKHVHYLSRYADDVTILGYSKPWLHKIRKYIDEKLNAIDLTLKDNWQVYPIDIRGIDYLGYRTFRGYRLLRKTTKMNLKKAAKRLLKKIESGEKLDCHDLGTLASYNGVLKWCNSYRLNRATLAPINEHVAHLKQVRKEFSKNFLNNRNVSV